MATNTAKGSVLALRDYSSIVGGGGAWDDWYTGAATACVGFDDAYNTKAFYVFLMKFKTPKWGGIMESIRFEFLWEVFSNTYTTGPLKVRYAVCTSDENKDMYLKLFEDIEDENQVVTGIQDWDVVNGETREMEIDTRKLQPDTEYYLFLWPRATPCRMCYISHTNKVSIAVNYNVHSARIEIGSELKRCLCYVENGESWFPIAPNEDNGTGWDACS